MTVESPFRRSISATERMCFPMRDLAPPYAIQYVVSGIGVISEEALVHSISLAAKGNPGARLFRVGGEWVDSGRAPNIRVVRSHSVDWTRLDFDPVLTAPLAGESTVEVLLLPAEPVTLVFRAFHGVMDGQGLALWMGDVFRALRGEDPRGAPHPVADHDLVARLGAQGAPTPLVPSYRAAVGHGAPVRGEPAYGTRVRTVRGAPAAEVSRIAAFLAGRREGLSRFMIPVDLRRHDPELRSTANLSLPLFLDVPAGQRWWEVNARLLGGLLERRELDEMASGGLSDAPPWLSRAAQRLTYQLGARLGRNLVSALISHVGSIDLTELRAPGFTATSLRVIPVHTMMIPLAFMLVRTGRALELAVSFRNGRGVAERVDALLDDLVTELESEAGPVVIESRVDESPARYRGETAVSLFRERVARAPESVAVLGPGGVLTYAELAGRADAVAVELRGRGVGAGAVVAVLAGRTPLGMIAQWGVLLAGAAFLPLDPAHPPERIREVLRRSGSRFCLVDRSHLAIVGDVVGTLVLEEIPESSAIPATVDVHPADIAYATYTSGSTGQPKGVQITHAGIVNCLASAQEWFGLDADTAYLHYHTPAADLACLAFFGAHLAGGAVVLVPDELDAGVLRAMLTDPRVNTVLLTPSLAEVVVELDIEPARMRTVVFAGEQLTARLAAAARRFFGSATRLVNSYGPAEMTLVCTNYVLPAEIDAESGPVPIGRPAIGAPAFLLDAELRPVAAGGIGELYFAGPQVARGYLDRSDLTAERFVALPSGHRAYRTGDLARLLPSGDLLFLGRADEQVKIRGYRIEPDEIRLTLESHPEIRRAAVIARPRPDSGEPVLAAFLVSESDLAPAQVRAFLAERLPAHMIPSTFQSIPELPRNGNGKLDRHRLPGPEDPAPTPPTSFGDSVPERVAAIWSSILGVNPASLHRDSDFLASGGNSLSAVRMLTSTARTVAGHESAFIAAVTTAAAPLTLGLVCDAVATVRGQPSNPMAATPSGPGTVDASPPGTAHTEAAG